MQVGEKKIALGIPGADKRATSPQARASLPESCRPVRNHAEDMLIGCCVASLQAAAAATAHIPLRRSGRVDDAAGLSACSRLLCAPLMVWSSVSVAHVACDAASC